MTRLRVWTNWQRSIGLVASHSMGGANVNFMMDEGADRVKASYGDNYKKLAEVKAKYDPGNLFRVNQNIKPAVV